MTFEFTKDVTTLNAAVYQALGFASTCWQGGTLGVFRADDARECGETLLAFIGNQMASAKAAADGRERLVGALLEYRRHGVNMANVDQLLDLADPEGAWALLPKK